MSCLENTKLEEQAFEIFLDTADTLYYDCILKECYFERSELWEEKEYGRPCEQAYERIFNWLLKTDYELTLADPMKAMLKYTLKYYLEN